MPNKSKDDNVGESDDLKRRREFMQYIRIKDETNDPDYEVLHFCSRVWLILFIWEKKFHLAEQNWLTYVAWNLTDLILKN